MKNNNVEELSQASFATEDERCKFIMNKYLELDKDERVPFSLMVHILLCKKCRTQIKMLSMAEKTIAAPLKIQTPITDSSIENVMQKIAPESYKKLLQKPISLKNWIISGITMILLLFVPFLITNVINNRDLLIAYSLLIAGSVTIYCSVFVVSNIDYFVKKISTSIGIVP